MIVDCHTHFMLPEHWGSEASKEWLKAGYGPWPSTTAQEFEEALKPVDRALVFGITARAMGVHTPNEYVASLVQRNPHKYIGFMALDPSDPNAIEEMGRCKEELGFKGIKLYPVMQLIEPAEERFSPFYQRAQELGLPILWHFGTHPLSGALLKYANPRLLDEVAARFPKLPMVIAHLGHPWYYDAAVLIRKHERVYADICGILTRPWMAYNALVACMDYQVLDKLLFGSDYPLVTPVRTLQWLRNFNEQVSGTKLPRLPESAIEALIHRDTLGLLGIGP